MPELALLDERVIPFPAPANSCVSSAELRGIAARYLARKENGFLADEEILRIFDHELDRYSVVSFDIFDTLLIRKIDHPVNAFYFLQNEPQFQQFTPRGPIHQVRMEAEELARQMLARSIQSGEVNLSEIYAVFCKLNDIPLERVASLVAAEENVERKLCEPNPFVAGLYAKAVKAGKRVVFASDMYLRKPFLLDLLREKGFPVSESDLFVSSDLRVSKTDLGLFQQMLKQLNVQPFQVLHVGDNPLSDYKRPEELGTRAILHRHKASSETLTPCISNEALAVQSYMRGMIRAKRHQSTLSSDFWPWLGYRVFGPLITGFCTWLEAHFRADSIEHAWFLMRDGELPKRVYDILFAGTGSVPASTLLSSRRAFVLPLLDVDPELVVPNLCVGLSTMPAREYLERLNVPAAGFAPEFRAAGFSSLEEEFDARSDSRKLMNLFCQPRVIEALVARGQYERGTLERYLVQEGVCDSRRIALVDLGWSGTIQKAAHKLLTRNYPSTEICGYYVGTKRSFGRNEIAGMKHAGYLVERGRPERINDVLNDSFLILELVFTSVTCGLICFEEKAGRVEGVFQGQEKSEEQCAIVEAIHEGVLIYAREFKEAKERFGFGVVPADAAAENLLRLCSRPTPEEAGKLGALEVVDNYGTTTRRHLARFSPTASAETVLEEMSRCCWSKGLLAQDNEPAMALRNLLWLLESAKAEL